MKKGGINLHYIRRFVLIYRIEKRKILRSNIDLCEWVINILQKLVQELPKEEDFKYLYLE